MGLGAGEILTTRRQSPDAHFDAHCKRCARLVRHLKNVKSRHPGYHCAPVPAFGDDNARLLIVGLAPGLHGANRSGRPFTGDHAGMVLYRMLHKHGFANRAVSEKTGDGLVLKNCRITNAVKCLPPDNKPTGDESRRCNRFLKSELKALPDGALVLALGRLAHTAVLRALGAVQAHHPFAHGAVFHPAPELTLLDSYHCSRYNTQTGRLRPRQFDTLFHNARKLLAA